VDQGSESPQNGSFADPYGQEQEDGQSTERQTRDVWLARALHEELRGPLLRAVLWTEHLLTDRRAAQRSKTNFRRGPASIERELAGALTFIEDLLVVIRPSDGSGDGETWLRSVVFRDLLRAALHGLEEEIEKAKILVEHEVKPHDLTLVADPEWTLHAVDALLRVGVRCTGPGEALSVRVTGPKAAATPGIAGTGWVAVALELSEAELPPGIDLDCLGDGRPWRWPGDSTGAIPLALAAAAQYAQLLEGTFDVTKVGPGTLRARLRLPTGREPERRRGWIP